MNETSTKARQALWLASRGMHVFPLQPGARIPVGGCMRCRKGSPEYEAHTADECFCIPNGRHCHGSHAATTDQNTIRRWWSGRYANAGIGIHLGKSGLIMLDIDSHKSERVPAETAIPGVRLTISAGLTAADGWDSLAFLAGERDQVDPWLGEGVKVLTPSGGLHIWYRVADPAKYKNIDGKLAWQVDVKAGPAFAVAPGTEVTGKGSYAAMQGSSWGNGPAQLPEWLDAEIHRVGGHREPERSARKGLADRLRGPRGTVAPLTTEFIALVMDEALALIHAAPAGQRNAAVNAAAFKVGRALVSRDETLRDALASELEDAATGGGTPAHEARATVASGILGGVRAAQGK